MPAQVRNALAFPLAACLALAAVPSHAEDLTVSAAASLTDAFTEIGKHFEAGHPGVHVLLNFGASGALLQQIAKGAPVDVFASADEDTMDRAQQQKLVAPQDRHDFAGNALVVIVPIDAKTTPASLADLGGPAVRRIAVGVPASVPVGHYTQAALQKAGLWTTLEPKTVGAQSVRQALDYVARGETDAGFVYRTDAAIMPSRVKVAFVVPTDTPVRYPAAVTAASPHAATARQFVEALQSADTQAVLARYGFGKP